MDDMYNESDEAVATLLPIRIEIEPEPTAADLKRWKELAEEADRIRAEIGKIDIRADELLHIARSDAS